MTSSEHEAIDMSLLTEIQMSRFGEVAEVIDIASTHVDFVTLLTPTVMRAATYEEDGACLDPNLPSEYIMHPPHR
jgi:hypothetical protein